MSVQFPIATRSRRSSRWRNRHRQSITLSPGGGGSAVTVCICTPTQAGIGPTPIQNAAIYCCPYPIVESFSTHAFGVGVRQRGAAVAIQVSTGTTYCQAVHDTKPTAGAIPL